MKSWTTKIFLLSFVLAAIFSGLSSYIANFNVIILFVILFIVMGIGILFDMVGVAVLSCKEAAFHAKASKKIKGAKESISLIKDATKVSSMCNDVIGDICGIISGSLGVAITAFLVSSFSLNLLFVTLLITALISAITVGGKSLCKGVATKKCEDIVFFVGKIKATLRLK